MDFIYNSVGTINGFDEFGHFQRATGLRSNCLDILTVVSLECAAFFFHDDDSSSTKKKKKKKKGKAAAVTPGGSGLAPAAPGSRCPRVEEVIPELDPARGGADRDHAHRADRPRPRSPTRREEGGEAAAAQPRPAPRPTATTVTMREASLLLQFLLGGSS